MNQLWMFHQISLNCAEVIVKKREKSIFNSMAHALIFLSTHTMKKWSISILAFLLGSCLKCLFLWSSLVPTKLKHGHKNSGIEFNKTKTSQLQLCICFYPLYWGSTFPFSLHNQTWSVWTRLGREVWNLYFYSKQNFSHMDKLSLFLTGFLAHLAKQGASKQDHTKVI